MGMEKELYGMYRSPNIFRLIKYRRLRWERNLARIEKCWRISNFNR